MSAGMSDSDLGCLLDTAREVRARAYAPYSGFESGAAVIAADGSVHAGVLVENIVFGVAMCAERVALFSSVTTGAYPVALALSAPSTRGRLTHPCGSCLQVAVELGGPSLAILLDDGGEGVLTSVAELAAGLPHGTSMRERRSDNRYEC